MKYINWLITTEARRYEEFAAESESQPSSVS